MDADLKEDLLNADFMDAVITIEGLEQQLQDAQQAAEAVTAQLEEAQRRCAMLRHACASAAIPLNGIDLSMHSNLAKAEIENSIEIINQAINATSTDTEQWLQNEIARRLGEPVMYRNTSNGDVCESTDSLAEPLYSIAFIKP